MKELNRQQLNNKSDASTTSHTSSAKDITRATGVTRINGVTLIEMLVAMLLIGIIMTALVTFFGNTTKASSQSMARAELQQETLNAQQLMASRIKEAYYLMSSGSITLTTVGKQLAINPLTGSTSWTVGSSPVLAMILPPEKDSQTSITNGKTPKCQPSSIDNAKYCYRFFAYFLTKRSIWEANANEIDIPAKDSQNADTYVLAEYKGYYSDNVAINGASSPISNASAALLAEYIRPANNIFTVSNSGNVTINLAVERKLAGQTIALPKKGDLYNIKVLANNLGQVSYKLSDNW